MKEQENTRLVERFYENVKAQAIERVLSMMDENIYWRVPEMNNVPFSGSWQGRQQVGQFFGKVAETQETTEFEPLEFIAQGDNVVVLGRFTMHVKTTGKDSKSDWAHVWTIKDGKIISFREFVDTAAVISAHSLTQTNSQTP